MEPSSTQRKMCHQEWGVSELHPQLDWDRANRRRRPLCYTACKLCWPVCKGAADSLWPAAGHAASSLQWPATASQARRLAWQVQLPGNSNPTRGGCCAVLAGGSTGWSSSMSELLAIFTSA